LPELPALRLGAFARPFLPAAAFAVVALLVPLSKAQAKPSTSYFDRAIEGLATQLEVLREVADLDPEAERELARRVEELAANVDAEQPEAMLEAIDSLRQALDSGLLAGVLENLDTLAPELQALAQGLVGNELRLPEGLQLTPEQMQALSLAARSQLRKGIAELNLAGLVKLADLDLSDNQGLLRELVEKFHQHDADCRKPGGT
jgi:hypothetical protein